MSVGVVGAGRMGRALARAVAGTGEGVLLSAARADATAPPSGHRPPPGCEPVPLAALWAQVRLVLLALPFPAALDLMRGDAGRIGRHRTLVDVTNPRRAPGGWVPPGCSGGELIASAATTWYVAKAFNTVPAEMVEVCQLHGQPVSVPVAGAVRARAEVSELARRLGFDPVDAGDISASRELESLAVLLMRVSHEYRMGGRVGIHIGRPETLS